MNNDINDKCRVFLEKEIPVHISKTDQRFANGYIKEIGSSFIILQEFKLGRIVIFFNEIYEIDTFTKEGNG